MTEKRPLTVDLHNIMAFRAYFNWGGRGSGQFGITVHPNEKDGTVTKITGSRECMSKESVRQALHTLVDTVINSLPGDDDFGDDFYEVEVPIPADVLESRAEWDRRMKECFSGMLDEDQSTSKS